MAKLTRIEQCQGMLEQARYTLTNNVWQNDSSAVELQRYKWIANGFLGVIGNIEGDYSTEGLELLEKLLGQDSSPDEEWEEMARDDARNGR